MQKMQSDVSAPNTKVLHTVGQSVALVDGDTERGVIARVQDKPGGAASRARTALLATYSAGTLNASNMASVIFSLMAAGLVGASVKRAGNSSD